MKVIKQLEIIVKKHKNWEGLYVKYVILGIMIQTKDFSS